MRGTGWISGWLGVALATLGGCSSKPQANPEVVAAATWVISAGGAVTLPNRNVEIRKVPDLPAALTEIDKVNLGDTKIADDDLQKLAPFKSLRVLSLYRTAVTDQGVEQLPKLARLAEVELSYTAITDAGLEKLKNCPQLQKVFVRGTAVTKAGAEALEKSKSGLSVIR